MFMGGMATTVSVIVGLATAAIADPGPKPSELLVPNKEQTSAHASSSEASQNQPDLSEPSSDHPDQELDESACVELTEREFAEWIASHSFSAEERIVIIEGRIKGQEALQKRLYASRRTTAGKTIAMPSDGSSEAITHDAADPQHLEAWETEKALRDFQDSFKSRVVTPEERAIQVERFLSLNHILLSSSEHIPQQNKNDVVPATGASVQGAENLVAPATARKVRLRLELERVADDLSQVDPETRANYLEIHQESLDQMHRESAILDKFSEPVENSAGSSELPTE